MGNIMKFTASGDALIMHRLPGEYPGRERIREFIERGDARITNLETTITDGNCFPSTFSGGTWLTAWRITTCWITLTGDFSRHWKLCGAGESALQERVRICTRLRGL